MTVDYNVFRNDEIIFPDENSIRDVARMVDRICASRLPCDIIVIDTETPRSPPSSTIQFVVVVITYAQRLLL